MNISILAAGATLYSKLPFDPLKDIVGVAHMASNPLALVVAPALGVKSAAELIALAKQKPGRLLFGSAGIGSGAHMGGKLAKIVKDANIKVD